MAKIILSNGMEALVDDADFKPLNKHTWSALKTVCGFYAHTNIGGRTIMMHRLILQAGSNSLFVDHRDKDTLNNQRDNLRMATRSQNNANRRSQKNSSSKYLGVHRFRSKWTAFTSKDNTPIYLGIFKTEDEAALAYNVAAVKYHGEFASLNVIP